MLGIVISFAFLENYTTLTPTYPDFIFIQSLNFYYELTLLPWLISNLVMHTLLTLTCICLLQKFILFSCTIVQCLTII